MKTLKSNDQILWAFTPTARAALDSLVTKGMDRDLAIELLSTLVPENELYVLDSEGTDS